MAPQPCILPDALSEHEQKFQRSVNGSPWHRGYVHLGSESLLNFFTRCCASCWGHGEEHISYMVSYSAGSSVYSVNGTSPDGHGVENTRILALFSISIEEES